MTTRLVSEYQSITNLFLFGSRLKRTQSERSDIDVIAKVEEYVKPSSVREFADKLSPALDIFLLENGRAVSCVNDSFLQRSSDYELINNIGAIEFWNKDIGFIEDAPIDWSFTIRADVTFLKTVMNPWYEVKNPEEVIIQRVLVDNTRAYIESIANQINICYVSGAYDGCCVLARRLIETLIIEVYETKGLSIEIKDSDGNYLMLKHLVNKINSSNFGLGRNVKTALEEIKRVGDLSAHSRRFKARIGDVDGLIPHIRVSVECLVEMAGFRD